jgi:hypothetical protein
MLATGGQPPGAVGTGGASVVGGLSTGGVGFGGATGASGNSACDVGPGNYCWSTYTSTGYPPTACSACSASWNAPPSLSSAHVVAVSPGKANAGMSFRLAPLGAPVDIAAYDTFTFQGTIRSGSAFDVWIGDDAAQQTCKWTLIGAGPSTYSLPLARPDSCYPKCVLDLHRIGVVGFATREDALSSIDVEVSAVAFKTANAGSTEAAALNRGPGDWCWSTFAGTGCSSSWLELPAAGLAHFRAACNAAQNSAGAYVVLPPSELGNFDRIEVDAASSLATTLEFGISRDGATSGCSMQLSAQNGVKTTYVLNRDRWAGWSNTTCSLSNIDSLSFNNNWSTISSVELALTAVRFCNASGCTLDPRRAPGTLAP